MLPFLKQKKCKLTLKEVTAKLSPFCCTPIIYNLITLKLELGGVRIVALSDSTHEHLNKTEPAVFLYCRFSISEGSVFQIILMPKFMH